ncbi:hypothetical protein ACFWG5_34470 [Streptomyces hydrogenans]|uniref:hypothetical protein n=1 Tax=Streptomyces TaxID=1883 RepID=UPI00363FFBCC
MDTQTTQPAAPTANAQGTHMYVLTVDLPGRSAATFDGTFTPAPGTTPHDVYLDLKAHAVQRYPEMARGIVTFFSIQPNTF